MPKTTPMVMPTVASSAVGEYSLDVFQDRPGGQDRHAEIAVQHLPGVDQELMPEGQVETHRLLDLIVSRLARPIANGCEHRVDRYQAPDDEGYEKQPEERRAKREQKAAAGEKQAPRSVKEQGAALGRRICL